MLAYREGLGEDFSCKSATLLRFKEGFATIKTWNLRYLELKEIVTIFVYKGTDVEDDKRQGTEQEKNGKV